MQVSVAFSGTRTEFKKRASLVQRASAPETKDLLKAITLHAIELGVFGVPTTVVGTELFWGADQMDWITASLDGEDPLDRVSLEEIAPQGVGRHRRREAPATLQA